MGTEITDKPTAAEQRKAAQKQRDEARARARVLSAIPVPLNFWLAAVALAPKIAKANELQELDALLEKDGRLVAQIAERTPDKAKAAATKQQRDLAKAVAAGEPHTGNLWSPAEWADDFARERTALKAEREQVAKRAAEILKSVFARLAAWLEKFTDEQIGAERAQYDRLGVPYAESPLVQILHAAGYRLLNDHLESSFFESGLSRQIVQILKGK